MNRLTKILSIIISVLLVFSLVACADNAASGDTADTDTDTVETDTAEPVENDEDTGNDSEAPAEPDSEPQNEVTFIETTIAQTDECTVIAKSYGEDSLWGPTFTLYLENNTADKTLLFSIIGASVNGFMCDPLWAEEVAAGKKTNSDVSWSTASLERNGINYMKEVEFTLRVHDSDDWGAEDFFNETVTLTLENTSEGPAAEPVVYDHGFSEQTLASTDAVTVIAKDYGTESLFGEALVLYLDNNSDKTLMFSLDDVSVNGFMCDPFWSVEVMPGKKEYSYVSWMSSTLEENDITAIEKIEATLRIYDSDDWGADDVFNEGINIDIAN
jgi:hypothetical protein